MAFKKSILVAFCFVLFGAANGQVNSINKLFASNMLLADFDYLIQTLEDTHPNLYAYIPKEEFKKKTQALRETITQPMTKTEFYKKVSLVIALPKQGHTMVFWDGGWGDYKKTDGLLFPFKVVYITDHLYVDENYSPDSLLCRGAEIIAINGIPISRIIDRKVPYLRVRPNGSISKTLAHNWSKYLWLEFGFGDRFNLTYILPDEGVIREKSIVGVTQKTMDQLGVITPEKNFELKIDQDRSIATLEINSFFLDFDEYDSLLLHSFKTIREKEIQNLIIDIRRNNGGNGSYPANLIDYLTDKPFSAASKVEVKSSVAATKCYTTHPIFINAIEQARKAEGDSPEIEELVRCYLEKPAGTLTSLPQKEIIPTENSSRFSGKLYVLIGENTFSAGTGFAVLIKDYGIGTLVGEETADNPTDYGSIMLFDLPNTGITIQNSTQFSVRPAGYDDERGVIPDYKVQSNILDFLNGSDRVMEYTLWLIGHGINK